MAPLSIEPHRLDHDPTPLGGTVHKLIASPFLGQHLIVRPGSKKGLRIGAARYTELSSAQGIGRPIPDWLASSAEATWGVDLRAQQLDDVVLVRPATELGYARAS